MRPNRSELARLYGPIEKGIWIDQPKWMMALTIPGFLEPHWKFNGKTVKTMYVHRDMVEPLYQAWGNMQRYGTAAYVDSFDGCFCIRASRSDNQLSVHSYGLAIDINASTNKLGDQPKMHSELVKCFELAGFVWGGRWKKPDGMHMSYVNEDK